MKSLYQYKDYREFIKDELDSARYGRGGRSELARKLNMELSLLSRILSGKSDFTPEHGFKAATFFNLDDSATRYFILLLSASRAGTTELKNHYQVQIDKMKDAQNKIKAKIPSQAKMGESELLAYYGSWQNVYVHMAVRNERLRSVEALSKHLRISAETTRAALRTLEKLGLVKEANQEWKAIEGRIHFSGFPTALRSNHINLRTMAIRSYDELRQKDMHYSLVLSADSEAVDRIRELILDLIKTTEPVIAQAKDEKVLALALDFFQVGGDD